MITSNTLFPLREVLVLLIFNHSICYCSGKKQENRRGIGWIDILDKELVHLFWKEACNNTSKYQPQ
jgi:hypothetical protein